MRVWRLATILVLAAGTFSLLLAYTFDSLSPLSSSMAALVRPALWADAAAMLLGLLLNATTFRERPATRGPNSRPGFRPVPRSAARRSLAAVATGFVLGWVSLGAFIYLVQDQLVFSSRGLSTSRLEQIRRDYPYAEDIETVAGDGTVLRGWLLPPVTWAQPRNRRRGHRWCWSSPVRAARRPATSSWPGGSPSWRGPLSTTGATVPATALRRTWRSLTTPQWFLTP